MSDENGNEVQGLGDNQEESEETQAQEEVTKPLEAKPQEVDWKQHIPAELKDEKFWGKYSNLGDVLKATAEGQKYIGGSIKLPAEDASQSEWDKIYNKMGRPEDSEGYDINFPPRSG